MIVYIWFSECSYNYAVNSCDVFYVIYMYLFYMYISVKLVFGGHHKVC